MRTKPQQSLIQKGLLTRFQASQLLAGKHRGFRLGAIKILDKLGKGGNGSVFLCEQVVMRRKVAVKVLPEHNAKDLGTRERFYREARAAAVLDHPNIVRTHDINSTDELHYLVMEYVEGTDLQRVLQSDGPLPYPRAVNYAAQAAAGLQHAHEKGLVHRDVKPANLLLGTDGVVKILDMGLARFFLDPKDDLTQQFDKGMVLGTIDFLAPEQAIASSSVDARADVYSLGATLYTLILGKPPFEGSPTQKLLMVQMRIPPALAQVRPDIPLGLSNAVAKMMAKDPADRYQTAAEVVEALSLWVGSEEFVKSGSTIITSRNGSQTASDMPAVPLPPASAVTQATAKTPVTTRVAPKLPAKPAVKKGRRKNSLSWLWYAGPGVALTALAITIVVMINRRPASVDVSAPNPQYASQPPDKTPPPADANLPPRKEAPTANAGGAVLYRFSAANQQPFFERRVGKRVLEKTGTGRVPAGWTMSCYREETTGEFAIEQFAGTDGFGLRCVGGEPAVQLNSTFEDRLRQLPVGGRYLVRFRYYAEDGAKGIAAVRVKGYKNIGRATLTPTKGQWRHAEIAFTAAPDMLDFTVQVSVNDAHSGVFITDLEFCEAAPAPSARQERPLYRLDLSQTAAFTCWMQKGDVIYRTGDGRLPSPWAACAWKNGSVGEVFVERCGAEPVVGMRHNDGEPSLQLMSESALAECHQGGRYLVRVEYRAEERARASLKARFEPNGPDAAALDLAPTRGGWRQAELTVNADRAGGMHVVVQNHSPDRAGELRLKAVEVCELR